MCLKKTTGLLILLTTLSFYCFSQKTDYAKQWKKIKDLEDKGLTQSALQEVIHLFESAVKEKNDAQQIKSCMFQIKYRNRIEEDSHENNIFFVDTLIAKATAPAKNILLSMQADMFWGYLQSNRWKFYDRTKLVQENSSDISTWSLDKLHATITKLYKASLTNANSLKSTRLDTFDPIIDKGENTRQLRPTLYDFLAHRALTYFMNDESDLTKPAYQFSITDPVAFASVYDFVQAKFNTKDSASLHHTALLIFQDLLQFHLSDAQPDALIDADLIRLTFINQYSILPEKEKLYEAALKKIEEKYPSNPGSAQAIYLRAKIYYDHGLQYNPFTKTNNQFELKKAKQLCESVVAKYPKCEGKANAQSLINQIKQPTVNIEIEKVNIPNQPFRSLVNYKNVKQLYFRIVKTSREEIKKLNRKDYDTREKEWAAYVSLKPSKTWDISLPDLQDYQNHATETKLDGLVSGTYFVLASMDKNFSLNNNIITRQVVYVSNISYINENNNYYVLNRDNGYPMANTQVQVWETKYNYKTYKNDEIKTESYLTDKNGFFKLKQSKESRNILLQLKNDADELFMDDNNYTYAYNSYKPVIKPLTFLFTDRSIYRPGQTIYFKGIIVKKETNVTKSSALPNYKTKVILRDANYQKIGEVDVTTNAFGSYKGSFKLPEGLLNGQFSLFDSATNGTQYFSVEEYKRPKFFVEIEKPKGTYRLNEEIQVTGTAKAYAGNTIDGAKIKYRVVRQVRYPIWWGWSFYRVGWGYPYGQNADVEITNGESSTNEKGEFTIKFKALPDESVDKKSQPTFYYQVYADVTDLNGETRSNNTSVAVAYQMLQLNIYTADKIPADSLKQLSISSTNLNGIFEQANIHVTIQKVQSPNKIFRQRFWQMPDQFIMTKEEYQKYFPYDAYKDEDQLTTWPLGEKVLDKADTTSENGQWAMGSTHLSAGWYKIIATTKDKYGEEVRAEKYMQLTDSKQPITDNAIVVEQNKPSAEPGEKVKYSIKTGFDNIWVIHTINKMDDKTTTSYPTIKQSVGFNNELLITENDRGGIGLNYAFIKNNRFYTAAQSVGVYWDNKQLNISYETFRDKLLPGSQEKWKVKITGNKGEKVTAELLAGMYDASLDQFKPHNWYGLNIWPDLYNDTRWVQHGFTRTQSVEYNEIDNDDVDYVRKSYDKLDFWETNYYSRGYGYSYKNKEGAPLELAASKAAPVAEAERLDGAANDEKKLYGRQEKSDKTLAGPPSPPTSAEANQQPQAAVQIRKNFNETAFFFPDLKTDADGNVAFSFTMPEALTKWKLMTLAHTKDVSSGMSQKTVVTQKPLMVQPNAPRFMREGDKMEFTAKVVNLSDSNVTGMAQLELLDAATNQPVDGLFKNISASQSFTIKAGQSTAVSFPIEIPFNFNSAMTYRIVAKAGNFSDGEEMALPVLTNRTLVTESLPLNLRGISKKDFRFEKLLNSGSSQSLSNHALTVEYTSNPAWYAVQALPYLMEYPYECAEQTFNRYFANTLASFISNSTPKINAVFSKWLADTLKVSPSGGGLEGALLSNLQKNEELKAALLQETPWVLDAQNESQQKKNIALLFDMVRMSNEGNKALNKLTEMQSSNGGFVWFKGGPDDRYITQYIITSIGHLKRLGALDKMEASQLNKIKAIINKAIPYLDKKIKQDYDYLIKYKINLKQNNLSDIAIQYLYMRSCFFNEYDFAGSSKIAYDYYRGQAQKYWLDNSKYMQAMIALALHHTKDEATPKAIIKSLKENSIVKEEMGMYWKEYTESGRYYWYQAPIETQALMIEAFSDIDKNVTTVDDLKTWLLKQKQTQNWRTTKATAEACYALLIGGSNWLAEEKEVVVSLGSTVIKSTDNKTEAGTGYFKEKIQGDKVKPAMGNISVSITPSKNQASSQSTSWGSVYWQYFEDLDKITSAETPLKLKKQLFIEKNSDRGPVLQAIKDNAPLKVGDKVKVRIELKSDRDMEYVHMKDMRGACMEPTNVISRYKYQGGLGYYESTKDASTNFFFSYIPRGTYVFEYTLFVTHSGNFSNGITTIQCMYAPEFTAHSEGIRVNVAN